MYYTESMVQMLEDLQLQANEMEKQVKDMMELEGRALGIELDKRKRAREYPSWKKQLEKIYDDGVDAWKSEMIDPIKNKYPKE